MSDRGDGGSDGQRRRKPAQSEADPPAEVERSIRGRIIIRSSSHPPGEDASGVEEDQSAPPPPASGGVQGRKKRDTPAERPRRRREVRAAQAMTGESSDHAGNAARPSGWQQASGEGRAQSAAQQARLPAPRSARRSRISLVVACLVVLAIAALVLLRLSSR